MANGERKAIGNKVAPTRFILFMVAAAVATLALTLSKSVDPRQALMLGFDCGALVFLISCLTLLVATDPESMRAHAEANDANRTLLLVITGAVMVVILAAVASEVV